MKFPEAWRVGPFPKPSRRGPKPRKRISRRQAPRPRRKGAAAEKRRAEHSRWRAAVMAKNGGRCASCQGPATDAAHIFAKSRYPHIRAVVENGQPLCRGCHEFYTRRPELWQWFAGGLLGARAYDRLVGRALEHRA